MKEPGRKGRELMKVCERNDWYNLEKKHGGTEREISIWPFMTMATA